MQTKAGLPPIEGGDPFGDHSHRVVRPWVAPVRGRPTLFLKKEGRVAPGDPSILFKRIEGRRKGGEKRQGLLLPPAPPPYKGQGGCRVRPPPLPFFFFNNPRLRPPFFRHHGGSRIYDPTTPWCRLRKKG